MMKLCITTKILVPICILISTISQAQKKVSSVEAVPNKEVEKSIQTFVRLLDSQHVQQFGLKSLEEAKSLRPGRQFKNYMISLHDIKNFRPNDDVSKIITAGPSIEVSLVNTAGEIRTSIEFVKEKDHWEPIGYGATPEIHALSRSQTMLADNVVNKGELIRIPSLGISFLAISSGTGLDFISIQDNQKLALTKGLRLPASQAILKLVPLAKRHNGRPT